MAPEEPDVDDTKPLLRVPIELLERVQSLLERMGEIESASTSWQVANRCAVAIRRTLDVKGVIIHRHDPGKGEVRIIGVDGPNLVQLLDDVASIDADFVASTVLSNGGTMTVRVDGELPRFLPERLRALGPSRSIIAVPVMSAARCVAIVELVDVDEECEPIVTNVCGMVRAQLVRGLSLAI